MLFPIALGVLGAMVVVMLAAWAFGLAMKDGGWTDVFWTWGTGVTLAGAALYPWYAPSPRQWLAAAFMAVWALRLGLYLTPRVATHPEDRRYAAFRATWGPRYPAFMLFVTLPQAGATALLGLSVRLAAADHAPAFGPRDILAIAIFLAAIAGEYVSDRQMKRFRDDPANKGQVMDRGLWAWSRHPNYFFQWLGWMAYPAIAFHPGLPLSWLSFTAALVMFGLLRFISGVPPLEAAMLKTRGERFRSYQARVSAFVPLPPQKSLSSRMSLISATIDTFEGAPLPDVVRKTAIRLLVANARRELSAAGPGTEAEFARGMAERPIAEHTDAANAQHYEVPAEFFLECLGPQLKYSSCLYKNPGDTIAAAEEHALRETAEHAGLADGQRILELGCGWGSLSLWMAKTYPKARITAVSNSASQRAFILARAQERGLGNLEVITCDMNDFTAPGVFDRVVSVEMFEHMANWRALLARVKGWLKPDGRLFIHVFTHRTTPYRFDLNDEADWIGKYFFSGGVMPSHGLISQFPDLFTLEQDWRWNGKHYEKTALHWLAAYDRNAAAIRPVLERTYGKDATLWHRRWRLFFLATAGLFGHRGGTEWGVSHYRLKPA